MEHEYILTETPAPGVGLVQLNRPKALNALNSDVMAEVFGALEMFDADAAIGCMVLTGDQRAFAAGADIKEMGGRDVVSMLMGNKLTDWTRIGRIGKPIIAAVSGWALGGGCELALSCDMIVASETARFGQPEINLGVMPGAGGTQRMTRALGKALAMEVILADRRISAEEARAHGLVNAVYPPEIYLQEAIKLAEKVAAMPKVAARLAKEAVNKSYELTLQEGLEYEKRLFYILFGTEDKDEGMQAFIEKRPAQWKHR